MSASSSSKKHVSRDLCDSGEEVRKLAKSEGTSLSGWQIVYLGWVLEQIKDQTSRMGPHGVYVWMRGNYDSQTVTQEVNRDATFRCLEDAVVWMSVHWTQWKNRSAYEDDFMSFDDFWNFYWNSAQSRFGVLSKDPHDNFLSSNYSNELFPTEHLFFVKDAFIREFIYWVPAELFEGPNSRGNKRLTSDSKL